MDGMAIKQLGPERRIISAIKTKSRQLPNGTVETETELKFRSKETALDLLGRHYKLFTDAALIEQPDFPMMILPDNHKGPCPNVRKNADGKWEFIDGLPNSIKHHT
jgi:hypothetical protein